MEDVVHPGTTPDQSASGRLMGAAREADERAVTVPLTAEMARALADLYLDMKAERDALILESAELTKALTNLTCGGSEFFIRKNGRYVADIPACVDWVRRRDTSAHEHIVREVRRTKAAEAALARLLAALTPSDETKAAYMGEFQFQLGGRPTVNVPWVTIKKIMAAIQAFAGGAQDASTTDASQAHREEPKSPITKAQPTPSDRGE